MCNDAHYLVVIFVVDIIETHMDPALPAYQTLWEILRSTL